MNIKIKQEKIWYSANIAELRIHTQWDSLDELWENIKDALKLYSIFYSDLFI